MFSTFTTQSGKTLLIRAVDLRVLEDDGTAGCVLIWEPTSGQLMDRAIQGTAQANLDRLKADELQALREQQDMQQRMERVERGRQMSMVRK